MIREQDALLLPCPLLNCPGVTFNDHYCDGSECDQNWVWSGATDVRGIRLGDCWALAKERRLAEMKRKREGGK